MRALIALLALAAAAPPFTVDLSLLRLLDDDAYKDEPFEAPYIATFEGHGKKLVFVSGDHQDGTQSPVGKTIKRAFETSEPKGVVVEGLTAGEDTAEWLEQARYFAREMPDKMPENYYPAYLAGERGIPFAGGEPDNATLWRAAKAAGFAMRDFLGLRVAANIGAMRADQRAPERIRRSYDGYFAKIAREIGYDGPWGYDEYARWYQERGGVGKAPNELTGDDARPDAKGTFIQRVAAALERGREETIVRQIEAMLRARDVVVVVYGSGHLVRQRPVWAAALSPSRDEKPF